MNQRVIPPWLAVLDDEDIHFIRRFVLASGSLKALATEYGVSYPTLRNRLDRLIEKVRAVENGASEDPFQQMLRVMVAGGKLNAESARKLMQAHRESLPEKENLK